MNNVMFLGPPGCGKGTQAALLSNALNYKHVSTGDLFRNILKENTELGKEITEILTSGALVGDGVVNKLIEDVYQKNSSVNGIILDGYPRNLKQAEFLMHMLNKKGLSLDHVFYFKISDDILLKRILGRYSCAMCGEVYNHFFYKTKKEGECDKCHSHEFIKRSDDNEEIIKNRLKVYAEETAPLLDFYKDILIRLDANDNPSILSKKIIDLLS